MAQKPEDKLLKTIQAHNNDLILTGKPVLVQNNLGIFFGFLEKSDTRSGTALLRDSFMLSPDRHITFSQYLDFLSGELSRQLTATAMNNSGADQDFDDFEQLANAESDCFDIPNEILVSESEFNEHTRPISITDYASEGVFLVQRRTSTHENSNHLQTHTPLISLTDVTAIAAISDKSTSMYSSMLDIELLAEDIKPDMFYFSSKYISPMFSFFLIDGSLNYIRLYKNSILSTRETEDNQETVPEDLDEYLNSSILTYVTEMMFSDEKFFSQQRESDPTKNNYTNNRMHILDFFDEVSRQFPSLVVNSDKRVELYNKKTLGDE